MDHGIPVAARSMPTVCDILVAPGDATDRAACHGRMPVKPKGSPEGAHHHGAGRPARVQERQPNRSWKKAIVFSNESRSACSS